MIIREEQIGDCRLILGDCLSVLPTFYGGHIICDPPYEDSLHKSKNSLRGPVRVDSGPDLKGLDFDSIDSIRPEFVRIASEVCNGWFIAFCTIEGVAKWAEEINESVMKYKRGCLWIKPDSTPQLNGQGPAQGAECFVVAWNGYGRAKWNAGGKRGVYTHLTNQPDRDGRHPTEKPMKLMAEIIMDFTQPGDLVLDPFMGIGATGLACLKTGRKFIGIEINEDYYNIAVERISKEFLQPDLFIETPKPKQGNLWHTQTETR